MQELTEGQIYYRKNRNRELERGRANYQKHRERRLAQVNAWNARQREKRRQERERLEAFRQGWRDRLGTNAA
jgi:hypothetical protein